MLNYQIVLVMQNVLKHLVVLNALLGSYLTGSKKSTILIAPIVLHTSNHRDAFHYTILKPSLAI